MADYFIRQLFMGASFWSSIVACVLPMEALELSFRRKIMIQAGQLVRCLDTGHLGVVVEKKKIILRISYFGSMGRKQRSLGKYCWPWNDRIRLKVGNLVAHDPRDDSDGVKELFEDWGWMPDFESGIILEINDDYALVYFADINLKAACFDIGWYKMLELKELSLSWPQET